MAAPTYHWIIFLGQGAHIRMVPIIGHFTLLTEIPTDNVPTDVHDFALKVTEHLREAFSYVQKHANTRIERLKRAYDTHVRPKTFTVGQLVYYYYPRKRRNKYHKWQFNYLGGYKIVKILNGTNYIIQRTPRSQAFVAHFDKLIAYLGDRPVVWRDHRLTGEPLDMRSNVDTGLSETECGGNDHATRPETKCLERRSVNPTTVTPGDNAPQRPTRVTRRPIRYQ